MGLLIGRFSPTQKVDFTSYSTKFLCNTLYHTNKYPREKCVVLSLPKRLRRATLPGAPMNTSVTSLGEF